MVVDPYLMLTFVMVDKLSLKKVHCDNGPMDIKSRFATAYLKVRESTNFEIAFRCQIVYTDVKGCVLTSPSCR